MEALLARISDRPAAILGLKIRNRLPGDNVLFGHVATRTPAQTSGNRLHSLHWFDPGNMRAGMLHCNIGVYAAFLQTSMILDAVGIG